LLVSSLYTATPEPAADGSNQTDVARALKQTSEALIRKTEELEAAVQELKAAVNTAPPEDPASIITGSTSSAGGGGLTPTDAVVDPILDRAVEQANALVRQAQAETRTVIAALQTALDNFKAGYEDTNAIVNATLYELTAQVGQNTASITEEELVRATNTQALAGRVSKITSVMNSNSAAITTEAVTRANADSALAAQITTVEAQTNSNTAAITAETIARTSADSALAAQITSVEAEADNATAGGFYRLTAVASPTNGAVAEFAVEVRATSTGSYAAAGMNIQAFSGGNRRIKFNTDQFIVTTGPDAYVPFAISGGNVYANDLIVGNANIEDGAITTAKIGNAEITTAKIGTAQIETLTIAGNAVTIPTGYFNAAAIAGAGIGNLLSVASLYVTLDQAGTLLIGFTASQGYGAGLKATNAYLQLNGFTFNEVPSAAAFTTSMSMSFQVSLYPGTHHVEVLWEGEDSTVGINYRSLTATGLKR
jgi:hypothetical protein